MKVRDTKKIQGRGRVAGAFRFKCRSWYAV